MARVEVPSLMTKWSHMFTAETRSPVLVTPLSYDMGVLRGGVFLKATLEAGPELTVKVGSNLSAIQAA